MDLQSRMLAKLKKAKDYVLAVLADGRRNPERGGESRRESFLGLKPEIWDKILGYLEPQDFLVAINSFPEWRELGKARTASALLPLVLPILADNGGVPLNSMLAWRRVNHKGRDVVDQILGQDATSPQTHYENYTSFEWKRKLKAKRIGNKLQLIGRVKRCYAFRDGSEIDMFIKHMGAASTPRSNTFENPLLTKSLRLRMEGSQSDEIFRFMLLARYGDHVSELCCITCGNIFGESLVHFVALLNHVPNLKILKLSNTLGAIGDATLGNNRDIEFPELKELKLLVVELFFENFMGDEQYSTNRLLLKFYGPQLTMLMCAENFFSVVDKPMLDSLLPNLKILKLKSVDRETLVALSKTNWRLEELQISEFNSRDRGPGFLPVPPYCIADTDIVRVKDLVRALNNFKDTLTHFQLNVELGDNWAVVDEFDDPFTLKVAPKLVKMTTAMVNLGFNWFWPLFGKKLPTLREMVLHTGRVNDNEMLTAQWNFSLFPKLERVRILSARPGKQGPVVVIKRKAFIFKAKPKAKEMGTSTN